MITSITCPIAKNRFRLFSVRYVTVIVFMTYDCQQFGLTFETKPTLLASGFNCKTVSLNHPATSLVLFPVSATNKTVRCLCNFSIPESTEVATVNRRGKRRAKITIHKSVSATAQPEFFRYFAFAHCAPGTV